MLRRASSIQIHDSDKGPLSPGVILNCNLSSSTTRTLRILKEAFVRIWGQELWARHDYGF